MHFPDRRPDPTEERILPLINVVFLLLIFFMLAGSLSITEPFAVSPPESASEGRPEPETRRLLLAADGRLALDGAVMEETEILRTLESALADHPGLRLELKADAEVPGNRVVVLMEALNGTGLEKLYLLTGPRGED